MSTQDYGGTLKTSIRIKSSLKKNFVKDKALRKLLSPSLEMEKENSIAELIKAQGDIIRKLKEAKVEKSKVCVDLCAN